MTSGVVIGEKTDAAVAKPLKIAIWVEYYDNENIAGIRAILTVGK